MPAKRVSKLNPKSTAVRLCEPVIVTYSCCSLTDLTRKGLTGTSFISVPMTLIDPCCVLNAIARGGYSCEQNFCSPCPHRATVSNQDEVSLRSLGSTGRGGEAQGPLLSRMGRCLEQAETWVKMRAGWWQELGRCLCSVCTWSSAQGGVRKGLPPPEGEG